MTRASACTSNRRVNAPLHPRTALPTSAFKATGTDAGTSEEREGLFGSLRAAAPVPEPASLSLLTLGSLALLKRRR